MDTHPSFLALDRHALGADEPAVARHVRDCATCAAHVEAMTRDPGPVPTWARPPAPRARFGRVAAAAAVLLAAAVAVLWLRPGPAPDAAPWLAAKGDPTVTVYVRDGEQVSAWDGRSVAVGDSLRLGIDAPRSVYVLVQTPGPERPALLWSGRLAEADARGLLPTSWRVTGDRPAETLSVLLDDQPLSVGADADWQLTLVIPVER